VSSVSLCHEGAPSVEGGGKRLFLIYPWTSRRSLKLTPHKGMCHAHTSGHRYDLTPLKDKGLPIAVSRQNDIRAFQLALGIAAGMQRTACGKSLHNMKGRTASPTSCSRTFLTGPGRKLSAKPNWSVVNNILGRQRTLGPGDTARPGAGDMRSFQAAANDAVICRELYRTATSNSRNQGRAAGSLPR
jgi:hypothetical protein